MTLKKRNGIALVSALILMVIFFALTVAFVTIIGYELKTAKENQITSKALYVADAGVQYAISSLRYSSPDGSKVLKDILDGTAQTEGGMTFDKSTPPIETHHSYKWNNNCLSSCPDRRKCPGQYWRDFYILLLAKNIFLTPLIGPLINVGDNYFGRFIISMDPPNTDPDPNKIANPTVQRQLWPPPGSTTPTAVPFDPPLYPRLNIYNLHLKVQGMVTKNVNGVEGEILAAKTLRVEILINTRDAECRIYRWYDAK